MSAIVSESARRLLELVKKDGDHKVIIRKDYVAGKFAPEVWGKRVPDFVCDSFAIFCGHLYISAGDWGIDGASIAPDKIGKVDIARGYIPHDLGYMQIEAMAEDEEWKREGWTEAEIRKLWDVVLGQGIKAEGKKQGGVWRVGGNFIARIYYAAVRAFGGLFHAVIRVIVAGAIVGTMIGCDGCAVPEGVFEHDTDEAIEYSVERK